ncbi:MAG: CatB-related O-acetyltransferase [Lutibacter sp.]|nr:CatB-related O-acetyltransferase [Lutibacter sp.]
MNIVIFFKIIKNILNRIKNKILFIKNIYVWRNKNIHNKTSIVNCFNFNNVIVGNETYGDLEVYDYGTPNEKLIIGNYVSIANGVRFLLGGNHQINTFTTYPLKAKLTGQDFHLDATTNGPIIIEDEVWIGLGATILSGIKIGRGAIVAAGSVVSKNIPEFAIAGGCPAKVIKYRYSEDIIVKLRNISLSDIEKENIIKNIDLFYAPIYESIEKIENLKSK